MSWNCLTPAEYDTATTPDGWWLAVEGLATASGAEPARPKDAALAPVPPPPALSGTGVEGLPVATGFALLLLALGVFLVAGARRRREAS